MIDRMSKQKILIPVEKIAEYAEFMQQLNECIQRASNDFAESGSKGANMDGWPTLIRGLQYVIDQSSKLVSPASKLRMLDPDKLLLPNMVSESSKKKLKEEIKSDRKQGSATRKKKTTG